MVITDANIILFLVIHITCVIVPSAENDSFKIVGKESLHVERPIFDKLHSETNRNEVNMLIKLLENKKKKYRNF